MQKTRYRKLINLLSVSLIPIFTLSWSKRSILLVSVLSGFYFTNSLISFLLDKSINTIFLAISILLIMELSIRSLLFIKSSKISLILIAINNFRIGSTYALILEAFKLGS